MQKKERMWLTCLDDPYASSKRTLISKYSPPPPISLDGSLLNPNPVTLCRYLDSSQHGGLWVTAAPICRNSYTRQNTTTWFRDRLLLLLLLWWWWWWCQMLAPWTFGRRLYVCMSREKKLARPRIGLFIYIFWISSKESRFKKLACRH